MHMIPQSSPMARRPHMRICEKKFILRIVAHSCHWQESFVSLSKRSKRWEPPSLIVELPSESLLSLFALVSDHKKARGFLLLFLESG